MSAKNIPYEWLLKSDQFINTVIKQNNRAIRKMVARQKGNIARQDLTNLCINTWYRAFQSKLRSYAKGDGSVERVIYNYAIEECDAALIEFMDSLKYSKRSHDRCLTEDGIPITFTEVSDRFKIVDKEFPNWFEELAHFQEENNFEYHEYCHKNELPEDLDRETNEEEYYYRLDKCMERFARHDEKAYERALETTLDTYVEPISMQVVRSNTTPENPEFCIYPTDETPHELAKIVGLMNYNDDFSYPKGSYPYYFYNMWFPDLKTPNYYTKIRKPSKKRLNQFVKDEWKTIFEYVMSPVSNMKRPDRYFYEILDRTR